MAESSEWIVNVRVNGSVSSLFQASHSTFQSLHLVAHSGQSSASVLEIVSFTQCFLGNSTLDAYLGDGSHMTGVVFDNTDLMNTTVTVAPNSRVENPDWQLGMWIDGGSLTDCSLTIDLGGAIAVESYGVQWSGTVQWSHVEWMVEVVGSRSILGLSGYAGQDSTMEDVRIITTVQSVNLQQAVDFMYGLYLQEGSYQFHDISWSITVKGSFTIQSGGVVLRRINATISGTPTIRADLSPTVWEEGESLVVSVLLDQCVMTERPEEMVTLTLEGYGGHRGVELYNSTIDVPLQSLTVLGKGLDNGIRMTGTRLNPATALFNGTGQIGLYSDVNLPLSRAPVPLQWHFHGIGEGENGLSFYSSPGFVVANDTLEDTTFHLSGTKPARIVGYFQIDWSEVYLDVDVIADVIVLEGIRTLRVQSLSSKAGHVQMEAESILISGSIEANQSLIVSGEAELSNASEFYFLARDVSLSGLIAYDENITLAIYAPTQITILGALQGVGYLTIQGGALDIEVATTIECAHLLYTQVESFNAVSDWTLSSSWVVFASNLMMEESTVPGVVRGDCVVDVNAVVQSFAFAQANTTLYVYGICEGLVTMWDGTLVTGDGVIDMLESVGEDVFVSSHVDGALYVNQLMGNLTYLVEMEGNDTSHLILGQRVEPLPLEFLSDEWEGGDVEPIQWDSGTVELVSQGERVQDQQIIIQEPFVGVTDLQPLRLRIFSHVPPEAPSVYATFDCPCLADREYCQDSGIEGGVLSVNPPWRVNGTSLCYDGPIDMNHTNVSTIYTVSDTDVTVPGYVEFEFRFSPPTSTESPTASATGSVSVSPSISLTPLLAQPSNSLSPAPSQTPFPSVISSPSVSFSRSPSTSSSQGPTVSFSPSRSQLTESASNSVLLSPSITPNSSTPTPTPIPTTGTSSNSGIPLPSLRFTSSPSFSISPSMTNTAMESQVISASSSLSGSRIPSPCPSQSPSSTSSGSRSASIPSSPSVTPSPSHVPLLPPLPTHVGGNGFPSASASPPPSSPSASMSPGGRSTETLSLVESLLCDGCEQGFQQISLAEFYRSLGEVDSNRKRGRVDIMLDDGEQVGFLQIPSRLLAIPEDVPIMLEISTIKVHSEHRTVRSGQSVGGIVTDITLLSDTQRSITQLNEPLTICLLSEEEESDRCLGYYDEDTMKWKCEDRCLSKEENFYCGKTDHLTSFALLLGSGYRDCEGDVDATMMWLSLGFVMGALCLICLSVLLIECYVQVKRRRQLIFLRNLAKSTL